ncbi:MAG: glycoside hydrolase family 28 protein [Bacteroidales bacterium]
MKRFRSFLRGNFIILIFLAGCTGDRPATTTDVTEKVEVLLPVFPDREYLITDYGAVRDGITLNTEAINKTIETCSNEGGGKVIIPEGVWVTGPIRLQSNVNLHVDHGAVVLFSEDFDDYPFIYSYFEGRRDYRAHPPLYGDTLENIAITGNGIFDGSGDAWRPVKKMKTTEDQWEELVSSGGVVSEDGRVWWPNEYAYQVSLDPDKYRSMLDTIPDKEKYKAFYRPALVQLISCDRVLLEGPLFQNSPGWCIHPLMCSNLTVNDIRVKNPWYAQNGDGIDVESCSNVRIRDSYFDVGDDAICIKSGKNEEGRKRGMPTQFVEVTNCVVQRGHGGFVVGSEMSGGVRDIWVSDCSFLGTDVGLRFKSTRGRGGVVENIHIENIRMIDIARDAIIFNLFYAGLSPVEMGKNPIEGLIENAPGVSVETPEFRNITIRNINCQGAERPLHVLGLPEMPVSGLSLENSVFSTSKGIHCLFANDLSVKDVILRTGDHPAMNLVNVSGAELSSLSGNQEVLFSLEGTETTDIVIESQDIEQTRSKTLIGKGTGEGDVEFREI